MNARQKAEHYKRKYEELWRDYIYSAAMAAEISDKVFAKIQEHEERQVTCITSMKFDKPTEVTEVIANYMTMALMNDPTVRQAVVFEGSHNVDTGKYELQAKLTVVIPELSEQSEDGFENEEEK